MIRKNGHSAASSAQIVVAFLNLTASSVPEALQVTAVKVLVPAANLLVNTDAGDLGWRRSMPVKIRLLDDFSGGAALIMVTLVWCWGS